MKYTIAYASDHNYINYLLLSMGTLLESNREAEGIRLCIIENGMTQEDKGRIESMVSAYGREYKLIPLESVCGVKEEAGTFSRAAYSRLYLDRVCQEDRVLYLDVDTIVRGSLAGIFQRRFSENAVAAAVLDIVRKEYKTQIGLGGHDPYYNSGVILWDMGKMREQKVFDKFDEFIKSYFNKYHKPVPHNDQGVFNAVCGGRIDTLPARFNMMSGTLFYTGEEAKKIFGMSGYYPEEELGRDKKQPVIIHFTEGYYGRPWNMHSTHPYKALFEQKMGEFGLSCPLDDTKLAPRRRLTMFVHKHFPHTLFVPYCDLVEFYRRVEDK